MTNQLPYTPQDFQKMCKQAERDHEAKKLVFLMERLKRQMAERSNPGFKTETGQGPATADCHGFWSSAQRNQGHGSLERSKPCGPHRTKVIVRIVNTAKGLESGTRF